MKKIPSFLRTILFFGICILSLPLFPAQGGTLLDEMSNQSRALRETAGYTEITAGEEEARVKSIIAGVIKAFLGLLGTIFFALLLYGGFLWMTASGNEDQIEKAKKLIRQAVIGLLIILSAYSITQFIESGFSDQMTFKGRGGL